MNIFVIIGIVVGSLIIIFAADQLGKGGGRGLH